MVTDNQNASVREAVEPRIVVGIDGSPSSLEALEWAIR